MHSLRRTAAGLGMLSLLVGCAEAATPKPDRPGYGAPPGARLESDSISPARKISSRAPTTVVGGPLLFRAPDRGDDGGYQIVLVIKLNRDPFKASGGENNSSARGTYDAGESAISDEGFNKSRGKYCFMSYISGFGTSLAVSEPNHKLTQADIVRVVAAPRGARPKGRQFRFDVRLRTSKSEDVDDPASLEALRKIGCGAPSF